MKGNPVPEILYSNGVTDEKNNEETVDMDEGTDEAPTREGSVEPNFSERAK